LIADLGTAEVATAFPEMAWAIEKLQSTFAGVHKTIGYGE
jgi:hypothetical protein